MIEDFKFLDNLEANGNKEAYNLVLARMKKADEGAKPPPSKSVAFVGINPPIGQYSMKELYNLAVDKYPYKDYIMVVEQNTKGGVRPHLHISHSVSDNTRKNHVISRLANIFKVEKVCINVDVSRSFVVISRRLKYIRGEKKEEKQDDVEKDIKDRNNFNIPHIYNDGSLTWCDTFPQAERCLQKGSPSAEDAECQRPESAGATSSEEDCSKRRPKTGPSSSSINDVSRT